MNMTMRLPATTTLTNCRKCSAMLNACYAISMANGAWIPGSPLRPLNNPMGVAAAGELMRFENLDNGWRAGALLLEAWFLGFLPTPDREMTWEAFGHFYVSLWNDQAGLVTAGSWIALVTRLLNVKPTDKVVTYFAV